MDGVRLEDPANTNNILEITAQDRRMAAQVAAKGLGESYWQRVVW
jgi:hypothetical protein